jgi:hypothetical protein
MDFLKFKKGLEENLPQNLEKDTFYISTDSKKLRLNDAVWEDTNEIKKVINENEKVTACALNKINEVINENEKVTAYALTELYDKTTVKNITYNELKALYDNSQLTVSSKYRITDYVTTTKQTETQSANHPFDIIVEALTVNTLNENAIAIIHDGDTYFNGNKLEHWEIKYCIHNDTSRFAWADTTNGKGVIYYMKDEFNNEAWYDFKNIQFLRKAQWFKDNPKFITTSAFTQNTYFYTFSVVDGGVIKDDTLYTTKYHATDNHLGRSTAKITKLNNTIFIDTPNNGAFNNIIADGHSNNTFGKSIWNNTIGHNCLNNIISKSFQYNDISSNFKDNHCWGNFAYNEIEAGCVNNRFLGNVTKCTFKQAYSLNNFTGETLSQCTFGMSITYISDMPSMTNVTFTNNSIVGTNSVYLNNLYTTNGQNLKQTIGNFDTNFEHTILLCENGKYEVFSHKILDKISNIHDLGSFENSGDAENAAKNANICTNANISLLKYDVPSLNKTGIIEQYIKTIDDFNLNTIQIIYWDGLHKIRTLKYINIGNSWSLNSDSSTQSNEEWKELKYLTKKEWDELKTNNSNSINTLNPIFSDPQLDFDSTSNNVNCFGYVGTLENVYVEGDNILIDSIGVYVREGSESPNKTTKVWCRLMKFVNGEWTIVSQSTESKAIGDIEPEKLFTFKMVNKIVNPLIKYNDKIAITYVDNENANVLSCIKLGFKAIPKPGYLANELTNSSTGNNTNCPAFVFGYIPTSIKGCVDVASNQTITGTKQFNNGINISGKSFITSAIDPGELKVLHNNSSKGFIIRTKNTSDSILPLEILTTNGTYSYKYDFPKTNGKVTLGVKFNENVISPNIEDGTIDLSDVVASSLDLNTIEEVTSFALNKLNTRTQILENKISKIDSSSSGNGAYAEVNHGTSDTTFTLTPNTFHIWDEVTTLDLDFGIETSGIMNEYLFQFTSGSESTTLILPYGIKFNSDLIIEENKIYQISILNGLGTVMSWDI